MQIALERDSIEKLLTFNICMLQLIFHAMVFSIQIFQYLRQIPPRVCTLVLFIIYSSVELGENYKYNYYSFGPTQRGLTIERYVYNITYGCNQFVAHV